MSLSESATAAGIARIKPEFLKTSPDIKNIHRSSTVSESEPAAKILKIEDTDADKTGNEESKESEPNQSRKGKKQRGQNKNRPRLPKFRNEEKLCPHYLDGPNDAACPHLPGCHFLHDVDKYLGNKKESISGECYVFQTFGKCPRGLTCLFSSSHTDSNNRNKVNEELWTKMEPEFEETHKSLIDKDTQVALRKHKFDFKDVEKMCTNQSNSAPAPLQTAGAITDADIVKLRVTEVTKIDWQDKLYLSPLTTVGNLPFRRLCVEMGADITCSEMSLASSVLQGNTHEFALHRRHPSEKLWGVQLCARSGVVAAKAAHVLAESGIDYDFVDLNMGCPLDPIYRQGAGSGLMCRPNKFHSMVKGMSSVLTAKDKSFTVKMRTGVKLDRNIAHTFIEYCRDNGVAAVTLHGRTREQRYLRHADWNYIGQCAKIAQPMALFGNGDVLSWDDYQQRKSLSNVTGVMIGRGALIKPWVFQEIKEQRHIDLRSSDRLELIRKYANFGLDHWGSDSQGVATTRRFLLEWLSFFHRYIPHGVLEDPPQRINHRPPAYVGRDEMETLLASPNSADWVKISEMFLGPVPEYFEFLPKHKANAWSNG